MANPTPELSPLLAPPAWHQQAVFYHVYPLGMCGAPWRNDFRSEPEPRLQILQHWVPYWRELGVNALYIGPLWESSSHGYDTVNFLKLDRRLGSDHTFQQLVEHCHQQGIRVVVDAVFNHVGRDYFAFRSLRRQRQHSPYVSWFENLNFDKHSPAGDPFWYEGWKGHYDLAKLNLLNPEVERHLFEVVRHWIEHFQIDGLRLDAADCMDKGFLSRLKRFCQSLRPDFWLMGEVVMGDYNEWGLDAITNYELYDALHKCHNQGDYTQLAHTLERQFGVQGVYRQLGMFNFVDNHDVNRIASQLKATHHLYPLYLLLFTLPGTPALYYGSEAGLEGKRLRWSDRPLRPFIAHPDHLNSSPHPDLSRNIRKLIQLRHQLPALQSGHYLTLHSSPELLVFERTLSEQRLLIAVNRTRRQQSCDFSPWLQTGHDLLNQQPVTSQQPVQIFPSWGRIIQVNASIKY